MKTVSQASSAEAGRTAEIDGLRRETHLLRQAVRSLACHSGPDAQSDVRWKVGLCLHPDGRLLLEKPVTETFYTGPCQLGYHVGLHVEVIPLIAIPNVVAVNQVGAVRVTPTFLPGKHDLDLSWPIAHHVTLSFPEPLTSTTLSKTGVAQLPRPLPQPLPGEGMKQAPISSGVVPVLLPPEAELGATMTWNFEIRLEFGWQTELGQTSMR